jgi:hypothetical protein
MGAVTLKGLGQGRSFSVRILDENGYIRGNGTSQVIGSDLNVTLPVNSLYTVVMMLPSITKQPQKQMVMVGGSANFSVSATGLEPLTYQWQFNGDPISGATEATFSMDKVLASQAGSYSVVITNVSGATTSLPAVLTVDPLLRVLAVTRSGNDIAFMLETIARRTYRLERKLALTDPTWQSIPGVADLTATGPAQIIDPGAFNLDRAFYRVRLLP